MENKKEKKLRIIPLGGLEEVGKNMTLFEYEGKILIVDMGLQFPDSDMPGVDYIIPNISYLRKKTKDILGVVFTHVHWLYRNTLVDIHLNMGTITNSHCGVCDTVHRELT